MIHVHLRNDRQSISADYRDQILEFGRSLETSGDGAPATKIAVQDSFASRHHARLERDSANSYSLKNLSTRNPVVMADGQEILPGESKSFNSSALSFWIGKTWIEIQPVSRSQRYATISAPVRGTIDGAGSTMSREGLTPGFDTTERPSLEKLARWFETIISVQRAAAGSEDFYQQAAQAVVTLIGFDEALVLSYDGKDWTVTGQNVSDQSQPPPFSRSILGEVVRERRTYYQSAEELESIVDTGLCAASPIFDASGETVIGAVYGFRRLMGALESCNVSPMDAQLLQTLAGVLSLGIARMTREAEAAALRTKFDQFFTPRLAREIEKDASLLEGREREITTLFADLRGFSTLSTELTPRDTCHLITDVLECWSEAIRQNDGVIVDYAGDSILAIWNAPTDQPEHAKLAALSALRMLADLSGVSAQWVERTGGNLNMGIGINTGQALVGNTGTQYKFKYGASGLSVNLASRVEAATKHLGVPILITDATKQLIGDEFRTRRLQQIRVVGVDEPVTVFELHGEDPAGKWNEKRKIYEEALTLFENRDWAAACQKIQSLLGPQENGETDLPSIILAGQAIDCLKSPKDPFDPIINLEEK